LVASVVAVLSAAVGLFVVAFQDRSVAGNPVVAAGVDGPVVVVSSTASESVTTSPSAAIGEAATAPSTSVATSTTSPAAVAGDAPPAGRVKPGVTNQGVATFYDSDGGGACLYDPGPDPLTAAMNWADYEDSKACGAYVLVRASNGASLTVRITNLCPQPCRVGQLDLSAEAFARLAAPETGEIPITWTLVSPEMSKGISLRYKTGSSPHWCGIQAIDHRNPVARLEVQAGGQWKQLPRTDYNYFLSENGSGCGGAIAVTDIYGERLVVDPLPIKPEVVQATGLQFAAH
jgi:expansin (peptidoglycan-binding protein)